ncbi:hypothetical protein [Microbacterium sp. No. 7]|uniref:hypothetical protein n=1 Tax=Microbacterium sp. No. 7 TaxID=1714373 RepID=UPI0012E2A402|nr:hypothetical protein [Microbacterium sp. No. 7]
MLVPGGHVFETDKNGHVDTWAWEEGYHNGPFCVNCGEGICEHCNRDVYTEQCDIVHGDVITVYESTGGSADPFRGASCPRCGREMSLTDEACDEHPTPGGSVRDRPALGASTTPDPPDERRPHQ